MYPDTEGVFENRVEIFLVALITTKFILFRVITFECDVNPSKLQYSVNSLVMHNAKSNG